MQREGVTLLEILAVIIIIGILAAIALPNFAPIREKALDKEASASLKLIQAAEKIYRLETDFYYPYSGKDSTVTTINTNLKLNLPTDTSRKWNYSCSGNDASSPGCADATRTTSGSGDPNKKWYLKIGETEQSTGLCP